MSGEPDEAGRLQAPEVEGTAVGADGRRRWQGADGPWPVGGYAARIKSWMAERERVSLIGEIVDFRSPGRSASVYFQLRDGDGGVPCSMWRSQFEKSGIGAEALADGSKIVVAGRPDYYPGSATAAPSFSFRCDAIAPAGEGELLRELERLRKLLRSEGLTERQAALPISPLPRSIGVVTGESGEARSDLTAALARRGWAGKLIWAFASVQDRNAAPQIGQAIGELAASGEVEAIVVTRGGGSLLDLWAFCDETLCRTVALAPVPVIAAVGHHNDRTLIDEVAAVSCSTPTHAAEVAVRLDCGAARRELGVAAARLSRVPRARLAARSRELAARAQAPPRHVAALRAALHQRLREVRASAREVVADSGRDLARETAVLPLVADRLLPGRRQALRSIEQTVNGHHPQRTLERGYARVERAGETIARAAELTGGDRVSIAFADGTAHGSIDEVSLEQSRGDREIGEDDRRE